jgi:hypothetical protein
VPQPKGCETPLHTTYRRGFHIDTDLDVETTRLGRKKNTGNVYDRDEEALE